MPDRIVLGGPSKRNRLSRVPRPPDWLIWLVVAGGIGWAAMARPWQAAAPAPAAAPVEAAPPAGQILGPASVFDPAIFVAAPRPGPGAGTAFSVSDRGVWLTARHVVEGCARTVIVTAPGRGVAAQARILRGKETAVLITRGGAPALPIAAAPMLRRGEHAWHPGFPQGRPGEAASALLRRANLWVGWRGLRAQPVLVFRETGRWPALRGAETGLSGAPALDGAGAVIGVTVAENPRRRRLYATTPASLRAALAAAHVDISEGEGAPMNAATWRGASDDLRASLSVAEVECLAR